jgi:gas vesicle protein
MFNWQRWEIAAILKSYSTPAINKNEMENSNNSMKLIGALLVGATIGVIGTLFVMNKDGEVGKMISGKTDELVKSLKERFNTMMEDAKRELEASKEKAVELLNNGKGRA